MRTLVFQVRKQDTKNIQVSTNPIPVCGRVRRSERIHKNHSLNVLFREESNMKNIAENLLYFLNRRDQMKANHQKNMDRTMSARQK